MRLPLSWLKELIPLHESPEEIAEMLTLLGLEVEAIEKLSPRFEGVVAASVEACEKHPNAERLRVAKVFDGKELHQVVCGAPNCREGIRVAFSPVGALLADGEGGSFRVKKAKLRGVESYGMLCSEKELQLSEEHEGIIELPLEIEEGRELKPLFEEALLEISLTPNLSYAGSVVGVARELSALLRRPYQVPQGKVEEEPSLQLGEELSVEVCDFEACPRYACRLIRGVEVAPSPLWLKRRLELSGIRSVNNVVDCVNYVLLETGHPLHAFDFEKIRGKKISVRTAQRGEELETLDGKRRLLEEGVLVIADSAGPLALAGVMGGKESEVGEGSSEILLESAYFEPSRIRKSSKRLGISTEASKKFERGCDPNQVIASLERAASLIQSLAGGKAASGRIDLFERPFEAEKISCRFERVNELLGTQLSSTEIEEVFRRFGFPCTAQDDEALLVEAPTYRIDLKEEIDLVEEVARLYGYDHIPLRDPYYQADRTEHAPIFLFERQVRERLIAEGLQEIIACDLIGPELLSLISPQAVPEELVVSVLNPSSSEHSILRPSLLPGMLQALRNNQDFKITRLSLFEIGRVHVFEEGQYQEQSVAGLLLSGERGPSHWSRKGEEVDFYELKGMLENLFASFVAAPIAFEKSALQTFHPGRQAALKAGDLRVGSLGEVHPALLRRLDIGRRAYYAEINLHDLLSLKRARRRMKPLPVFPSSERDWTVTLPEELSHADFLRAASSLPSKILERVELIGLFRSEERIGKGKKNATFRFTYRDSEKTLSQEEVDREQARLEGEILSLLGKRASG